MPLSEYYFKVACEYENKAHGVFFINDKHLAYAYHMLRLAVFHAKMGY